jgi:hypothetical protein
VLSSNTKKGKIERTFPGPIWLCVLGNNTSELINCQVVHINSYLLHGIFDSKKYYEKSKSKFTNPDIWLDYLPVLDYASTRAKSNNDPSSLEYASPSIGADVLSNYLIQARLSASSEF